MVIGFFRNQSVSVDASRFALGVKIKGINPLVLGSPNQDGFLDSHDSNKKVFIRD